MQCGWTLNRLKWIFVFLLKFNRQHTRQESISPKYSELDKIRELKAKVWIKNFIKTCKWKQIKIPFFPDKIWPRNSAINSFQEKTANKQWPNLEIVNNQIERSQGDVPDNHQ